METAVARREIRYIWHFTRLQNLDAILENGIIPRATIESEALNVEFNDAHRFDGQPNASCFSIGHPNYKMFYSLRAQYPTTRWVVLGCRSSVLWEKDCAFCHENAASNSVTCIPIQDRKGAAAFERIFAEVEGKPTRAELDIGEKCPTNPQAEVLVYGTVEPAYIVGAIFQDKATANAYATAHPQFEMVYNAALFSARKDYAHWR